MPLGSAPFETPFGLLAALALLTSASAASAECSWSVRWPNDERIWAVPWGAVPRDSFVTKAECDGAIEKMLQEAMRSPALLIEVPACVCVPGHDDLAARAPMVFVAARSVHGSSSGPCATAAAAETWAQSYTHPA